MDPASWARHRGDFRRLYCRGQRRSGDLRRLLRRVHIGVRRRDDHRQRVPELPAGWGSGVGESRARREGWRGGPGRVGRRDEAERGLAADERLAMDAPDVVSRAAQTAKTPLAEDVRYMDPKAIRFSQEYVSPRFGGRVAGRLGPEDLAEALRTGAVRPPDVEPIRVFRD